MKYDPRCICPLHDYDDACPVTSECGNHPRSLIETGESTYVPEFQGKYRFLSNFWPWSGSHVVGAPIVVYYDGVPYPTSEHAFAAAKTLDPRERQRVLACSSPAQAKRLGHTLHLRADWDAVRVQIMWTVCMDKFSRNVDMRHALLFTRHARLVEGNTWGDRFWGGVDGQGLNMLGQVLMSVRAVLSGQM